MLIELEGLAHVLREAMDLVLDYGELVGLVDVVPPLGVDSGLGGMHIKNIIRAARYN